MSHRKLVNILLSGLIMLTLFHANSAFAQNSSGGSATSQQSGLSGTRKQIAIIIFSGLAGGILGLSTLSFYGRPQDHLSNIALGFAVGIISGTIYTSYKAATRPYDTFDNGSATVSAVQQPLASDLAMSESMSRAQVKIQSSVMPLFGYSWTFK